VIHTLSTQQQSKAPIPTGATVLKEPSDAVLAQASTHDRLRTSERHSAARPVTCPRTCTPPPLRVPLRARLDRWAPPTRGDRHCPPVPRTSLRPPPSAHAA